MLLLKNCSYIAQPDEDVIITDSDILIEGSRIKKIGEEFRG